MDLIAPQEEYEEVVLREVNFFIRKNFSNFSKKHTEELWIVFFSEPTKL
jgi:hypothetical protein